MALISNAAKRWPGGIVPFVIDQDANGAQSTAIKAGIALVTGVCPGVAFVSHASEPSWIHFMVYPDPASLGSESSTGMHPGAQLIWVSSPLDYCMSKIAAIGTVS
jgi:hypothetical protein